MTHSFPKDKLKILLLEGIDSSAKEVFLKNGYSNVTILPHAAKPDELKELLKDVHILGIRSATHITPESLTHAHRLFALGCFCIGTNQVDLSACTKHGIAVFNAPHSNTRSVAELVIGLAIMLVRNIFPLSLKAHQGVWLKTAQDSYEIRGKVIGIVGYGHIGMQVSILAESLGMQVIYYDILTKLPLGNARAAASLQELLSESDIVTLHVPETEETKNLINRQTLEFFKKGSCLINYSRGSVIDIDALVEKVESGWIKGGAVDVFPYEPKSKEETFKSPLQRFDQMILTPHIGGSTKEAQVNIAKEVAGKLAYYSDRGSTEGSVNMPNLHLAPQRDAHRILHIHDNVPGMLQKINKVIADRQMNVLSQYLLTTQEIGYVVLDVEKKVDEACIEALKSIEGTKRVRLLY